MKGDGVPLLRVQGLTKRFGGVCALRGLTLFLREGETVGMIGPNGSGKSTFVNVLSGELRPDAGAAEFRGKALPLGQPHQIVRMGIARTFQHIRLYEAETVWENVRVPALAHYRRLGLRSPDEVVEAALADVGLLQKAALRAGQLTLYEKRLLEIAMRLATRPQLLMLDEPAAGLNAEEIRQLLAFLKALRRRLTLFIIEHTMRVVVELADRVVVLSSGEKIAEDTPQAILVNEEVIRVYLGGVNVNREGS